MNNAPPMASIQVENAANGARSANSEANNNEITLWRSIFRRYSFTGKQALLNSDFRKSAQ